MRTLGCYGLRDADTADAVEVRWRDGSTEVLKEVRTDRLVHVTFDRP
jgi:hypothetical protein